MFCLTILICYVGIFFNNSRDSDPKILRINHGKSQQYTIPENAPTQFCFKCSLNHLKFTATQCTCAFCDSVSVVIFLSFVIFIINRVKSKEEEKQVQGMCLLSHSIDCQYKLPRCQHITNYKAVFIANAKVSNPVQGLDHPVPLLYLFPFHFSVYHHPQILDDDNQSTKNLGFHRRWLVKMEAID